MKIHIELEGAAPAVIERAVVAVQAHFRDLKVDPHEACSAMDQLEYWDMDGPYEGKIPLKEAYALAGTWSEAREIAVRALGGSTTASGDPVNLNTRLYLSED